jgi:hypothetical protein
LVKVISYDQVTGVLKYWQDRSNSGFSTVGVAITNPTYGFDQVEFTSTSGSGGNVTIVGGSVNLGIDTSFTGISTVINNRTYYLGQLLRVVLQIQRQKNTLEILFM